MDITFREYREEDKGSLLELSSKLEEYVKNIDPLKRIKNLPGYFEASLRETMDKVNKFQGKIFLAEYEGKIVGYIIGIIKSQSEIAKLSVGPRIAGEVIDLFVEEDYRGKGVGTKLLQMMENYLKEKGCDSMFISVFVSNEKAHEVYKKQGFIDREIEMLKEI